MFNEQTVKSNDITAAEQIAAHETKLVTIAHSLFGEQFWQLTTCVFCRQKVHESTMDDVFSFGN